MRWGLGAFPPELATLRVTARTRLPPRTVRESSPRAKIVDGYTDNRILR